MSDINLGLSLHDIILCRCVFTVWLDVLFPSQVRILASANTSCIRARVTSVLNLPRFYLKKMASCWPMALFSRTSAVNYRAFANDITKSEVCTYILSHSGVPHAPSISLCLSCKIHLFASNPLCGANLSHPTCAAYLLSLLHNGWLSGALTVQRHHVCSVLKTGSTFPKPEVVVFTSVKMLHIQTPSYNLYILMLPLSSLHLYKMLFSHVLLNLFLSQWFYFTTRMFQCQKNVLKSEAIKFFKLQKVLFN